MKGSNRSNDGKNWAAYIATAALVTATAVFLGCDSGGGSSGGGGGTGDSSVMGTVAEFSGGTALFVPVNPAPESLWARVKQLVVPSAHAAVGGVGVSVEGTDMRTTTASDGLFVVSGLPPGQHDFKFTLGDQAGILSVNLPAGTTLELQGVRVTSGAVTVDNIVTVEVVSQPAGSSSTRTSSPSGDGDSHDGDSQDHGDENSTS